MNTRLAALLTTLLLVLAACSGADSDSAEDAGSPSVFDDESLGGGDDGASSDDGMIEGTIEFEQATGELDAAETRVLGSSGVPIAGTGTTIQDTEIPEIPEPIDTGRDIIRTAQISAEVPDLAAASQQVLSTVQAVGGLLFNQDTRIGTEGQPNRTTMVFRVPPSDFQSILNQLSGIGTLLEQTVDATDVTGRVVDLESRITSTELSVERLRGFLAEARDLNQIATFENELRNRETELETLRGQVRTLQNQVALSTITVALVEAVPPTPPTAAIELTSSLHRGHDGGFSCGASTPDVEAGTDVTVCYEVFNSGDTELLDIAVRDSALGVGTDDLLLVQGSLDRPLEPGARLVFAYEFVAEGTRMISVAKVQASAPSVDEGGDAEPVESTAEFAVPVFPAQTAPGFGDGLRTGWNGLSELVRVVLLLAGVALPFIWAFPAAFFAYRAWRRRDNPATETTLSVETADEQREPISV
ncbi:MAG: DUF4349 domain-containing protein [Acidimicrobiales bacterium]|nr:DUF4349 domain-containing protein [Acidimicrobiales bacterium]